MAKAGVHIRASPSAANALREILTSYNIELRVFLWVQVVASLTILQAIALCCRDTFWLLSDEICAGRRLKSFQPFQPQLQKHLCHYHINTLCAVYFCSVTQYKIL